MAHSHSEWLQRFFAKPNGLSWTSVSQGSEPPAVADVLRPWLSLLGRDDGAPIILPFVRDGVITGWYGVARSAERSDELRDLLAAWFGYTWLSRFEATNPTMSDPLATVLREAFGGTVFRFAGADAAANHRVSGDLITLAQLLARRPARTAIERRPVGVLRAEFDRALLVRDEARATAILEELKSTGRLNDENVRYLEVRLRAGLGLWPQIAHDHWLIRTLSDLTLPPQILADLIEALYRIHIEPIEPAGDTAALRSAFREQISSRYPRLFASRRGIRAPRVLKAFLLFEHEQASPNPEIIRELVALLPTEDRTGAAFAELSVATSSANAAADVAAAADAAFEDDQFDRAFAYYIGLPLSKRSLGRLILCASMIETPATTERLAVALAPAGDLVEQLAPALRAKLDALVSRDRGAPAADLVTGTAPAAAAKPIGWINWAEGLSLGKVVTLPSEAAVTWDASSVLRDPSKATAFADLIGNLAGEAALVARQAVPAIYATFVAEPPPGSAASKHIASTLLVLIAMDESLSQVDLELLAQLFSDLAAFGTTTDEYLSIVDVLTDVQNRVASYTHLPWSLDIAEALAIAPAPSAAAQDARLQFFLLVIARAQGFEHRLRPDERHAFRMLTRDFGLDVTALGPIGQIEASASENMLPDLSGKTIGIYTLTEAAGARAKTALEEMFPGVAVTLNADQVATARLTSLARNADYFVFAWRSSSHSAYYCVKDALGGREPIMPQGKGSASILRAVIEAVNWK